MNVLEIPFVQKVGLTRHKDGYLILPMDQSNENHIQTVHASAQFTLAETLSGEALQKMFPQFIGKVVPILRESQIKFKKPASGNIHGLACIHEEAKLKFEEQMAKKGRAAIRVEVEIKNENEIVTCIGYFEWFVQRLDE